MIEELVDKINKKLNSRLINPKHALNSFKLNNEDYRRSSEYTDPVYYPVYYYLGKELATKSLVEFGFESGIESGCFIHGCKTVESFLGFRKNDNNYWSSRLVIKNIYNVLKKPFNHWNGDITDPEFLKHFLFRTWDCALVVRPMSLRYLELIWGQMSLDGVMIVDQNLNVFKDFCKIVKRPTMILRTRYGTGILIK